MSLVRMISYMVIRVLPDLSVVQNLNLSKVLQSRIVRVLNDKGTIVVNWPKRGDMEITGTQAWNGSRSRRDNDQYIAETLRKGLAAFVAR